MKVEFELEKKIVLGFMTLMLVGMFSLVAISATQPQAYVEGGQGLVSHAASDISGSINADTIDGMHASDLIGASGSGTNYVQTFYGIDACPTGWQTAVTGVTHYENYGDHDVFCAGDGRSPGSKWGGHHVSAYAHAFGPYGDHANFFQCVVCYR